MKRLDRVKLKESHYDEPKGAKGIIYGFFEKDIAVVRFFRNDELDENGKVIREATTLVPVSKLEKEK